MCLQLRRCWILRESEIFLLGNRTDNRSTCDGQSGSFHFIVLIQIGRQHQLKASAAELSIEEAENLVKDVFNSAGERDIYTGDFVEFMTISKDGISLKKAELKLD